MKRTKPIPIDDVEEQPTTNDCVLTYMYKNLPPERWTLDTYITLAWMGDKELKDLEGEELAMLPVELYPVPVTRMRQ
jgi:hypothetical protein